MLEKINEESFGVINLKLKTGTLDSELSIIDANRLQIEEKIKDVVKRPRIKRKVGTRPEKINVKRKKIK